MDYKYQRRQIFGKRLKVPKNILNRVYNCTLSFNEYIEYQLDDKIPTSCIIESDRIIVEKFGVDRCKELDWELIDQRVYYSSINFRDVLMTIDSQTEDINSTLYELVKDKIKPIDYSSKMQEVYQDRLLDAYQYDPSLRYLINKFNEGNISLKEIVYNWDIFKDKDLSYCLLNDNANEKHITNSMVKEFMTSYSNLATLIIQNNDIYEFISNISVLNLEEEKKEFVKKFTDDLLSKTHNEYGSHISNIEITDEQYREIFKYSSVEEYLKVFHYGHLSEDLSNELQELPLDYLFTMPIPFSELLNSNVLTFIGTYGLKNVVDFDNECGHFFTKNNCEMLKLMYDMYLHYGINEHDPNKTIYTKSYTDENGNYVKRPYTKDEFYEAMRRMIIYGPSDWDYADKAPDYRDMTGEFRIRNAELFISEQAPQELQRLFYTKSITPGLLIDHPEYIEYLKGKDLSSCFKSRDIKVEGSSSLYGYENIYKFLISKTDFNGVMNFITEYSDVLDIVFNRRMSDSYIYEIKFSINDDLSQIKDRIHETLRKLIIEKGLAYPSNIPKDLREKYPSMFLDENAPQELQEAFYNRTITPTYILSNPSYREFLNGIDLEVLFKYMPVGIITSGYKENYKQINFISALKQTFEKQDALDVMIIYGKYIEQVYEDNKLKNFLYNPEASQDSFLDELDKSILQNIIDGNMKYDENIPSHFKNNNPTLFLGANVSQEIKNKFYNREFTLKDFYDNPELLSIFENTNIACAFPENMSWIIPLFNDLENFKTGNYNRMKVISAYSKIQDVELQKAFKEYVIDYGTNIDIEKIEYVAEVLSRLSLSNSSEIFTFRKELATQILKSENPLESLNRIEDVFIRNNIPTVGKIYSCFEILHPDFQGFDFDGSRVSPILKKSSTTSKKLIVFSDLIKSSFGSNNRSINTYLRNIEIGSNLYESIKSGEVQFDSLSETELEELTTFCNHLTTLYNNTARAKKENETFIPTGNVLEDIVELSKKLSPNGSLDYNLADRVIRMFCGFAGIDTLNQAKEYIENKVKTADLRNREAAKEDMVLDTGDFIKGIGGITYLRNILQNGSVSKEYLGSSAGSDSTPLDTDISMIMTQDGTISEKMNATAASSYGPIWFVLKNDDRFITTRTNSETLDDKKDISKMEVFYTGVLGTGHYGIRTGFASSEINYIIMENYDPRVGLEIAMNGFYIPVANKEGKIVFTPSDYDKIREKMNGLSYYEMGAYQFDYSINSINPELSKILVDIDRNKEETKKKSKLIYSSISKKLAELNLTVTDKIDLKNNSVTLFNTGSTGRYTNLPGDGDFDFVMQVDRDIFTNSTEMEKLRQAIITSFGEDNIISHGDIVSGDIRELKVKVIDDNNVEHIVEIDITFVNKTDKTEYASDVCVTDRLNSMVNEEQRNVAIANIILAKKLLKGLNAYKPARKDSSQGGMGGIGVENWILQNGGTLYSAAKSFVECANECKSFEEFKSKYKLYNFGVNHLAEKRSQYPHDDYIENMNASGYKKMKEALNLFIKLYEENVNDPCLETINSMRQVQDRSENCIDKYAYDSEDEIIADTEQIIRASIQEDIDVEKISIGQTGFMYQFSMNGKQYLAKAGVNKNNQKVSPARASIQESASILQKIISPSTSVDVKTYGEGRFRVSVQEKIANAKQVSEDVLIKEHTNELLGEYVCDYLLGNYDSDASNFIIDSNNQLRGIDKEQSFKYLLEYGSEEQQLSLDFSYSPSGSRRNIYPLLIKHLQQVGLSEENIALLNDILMKLKSISDEEYKDIFKEYAYAYDSNRAEEILAKILYRKKYFESKINEFIEQFKITQVDTETIKR